MNSHTVYSSASAAKIKRLQENSPIRANDTLLSKRSPKTLFALVLCQVGALCLASPSFALTIDSVAPKDGKVTVKWSGGTAPYQLEKSTDMKNWEPVDTETSSTSLTSIQTSKNGFYRVRNGSGGGGASGGNKIDTTAPSVPTGVNAANNSCSQVTVSWTASTDSGRNATGVKGYYVYRDGAFLRAVLAPATLTSDVGLSGSTTYTYTVRAYDGATNFSAYSTPVTTTTPVCADTTAPSVPAGVAAASSSCSQIDITWSPSTDNTGGSGLQSYSVYRNNAFWKQVVAPATSTSDTGLAAGTTASYTVMAIDKAGNQSALSAPSSAITPSCADTTAPSVPTGLLVTATSCSQINRSWAASTDNVGGTGVGSYYIYRDGAYLNAVVSGTSTSDAGLAASTSHSYAVTAVANLLTSSRTGTLTIAGQTFTVTQAGIVGDTTPPTVIVTSPASGSSVTVNAGAGCTWTPTSNATRLTCTPATGTGTGTMTWTAAANTGTTLRTATDSSRPDLRGRLTEIVVLQVFRLVCGGPGQHLRSFTVTQAGGYQRKIGKQLLTISNPPDYQFLKFNNMGTAKEKVQMGSDVPRFLTDLKAKLRRVVTKAGRLEEEMDRLMGDIVAWEDAHPEHFLGQSKGGAVSLLKSEVERVVEAARGTSQLTIFSPVSSWTEVHLDQKKLFLSPKLGALLQILAKDTGSSGDSFVGWKSRDAVLDALSRYTGSLFSDHTLTNLVYRLRKELQRQAELHPSFVQVHPKLGLRFAVKRKSEP